MIKCSKCKTKLFNKDIVNKEITTTTTLTPSSNIKEARYNNSQVYYHEEHIINISHQSDIITYRCPKCFKIKKVVKKNE